MSLERKENGESLEMMNGDMMDQAGMGNLGDMETGMMKNSIGMTVNMDLADFILTMISMMTGFMKANGKTTTTSLNSVKDGAHKKQNLTSTILSLSKQK